MGGGVVYVLALKLTESFAFPYPVYHLYKNSLHCFS